MIWRRLHLAVALAVPIAASCPLAAQTELKIKALDQRGQVLSGIRFAFAGVESLPTTGTGVTGLAVPEMDAGEAVKLDKPAVEALAQKLRDEAKLRVFFDRWELVPGRPWQEALEQALAASRTCAVFLGPDGLGCPIRGAGRVTARPAPFQAPWRYTSASPGAVRDMDLPKVSQALRGDLR